MIADLLYRIIPNFIGKPKASKRKYVGEEIEECKDFRSMHITRPHDRGYLLHWNIQSSIWALESYWRDKYKSTFNGDDIDLILTEPILNPPSLVSSQNEYIFEHHGFRSLVCCSTPFLTQLYHNSKLINTKKQEYMKTFPSFENLTQFPTCVVIDCGYSFSHIVPFYDGFKINHAIKRVNVGGKLLTNYLKEIVSYRYFNMMHETYIINNIKEKLCYVSQDYDKDLEICKLKRNNTIRKGYVLPDLTTTITGYVLEGEIEKGSDLQVLYMNNERISVPEVLFNPSIIGSNQCGIPEAIVESINNLPEEVRELMYSNIVITGGTTKFNGFKERLETELRKLVPQQFKINIYHHENPETTAWHGGVVLANQSDLSNIMVTKKQYEEIGDSICKKFSLL